MELIDQHTKKIMEGCKERALNAGLRFENETLEYIVTNRDLLELTPKAMIPTLYDYWVHDVEVLKEKGRYELYPSNPYETVINTRPAISYYNDNNPGWIRFRHQVFRGWDRGLANENFPRHTGGAVVLDGMGYVEQYMTEHPEDFLEYSYWMGIPIQPYTISLDRFKSLLGEKARKLQDLSSPKG